MDLEDGKLKITNVYVIVEKLMLQSVVKLSKNNALKIE
jgi:hypothetical protein